MAFGASGKELEGEPGFEVLFNGTAESLKRWHQVGPDGFVLQENTLVSAGGVEFGLLYYADSAFDDFILRLEFSLRDPVQDNSGVFIRCRDPLLPATPEILARDKAGSVCRNPAWTAVYSGFEVQIDEQARGDKNSQEPEGLDKNRTGAIYKVPTGQGGEPRLQVFERGEPLKANEWNEFEIEVIADTYQVWLNTVRVTRFFNTDPCRGLPRWVDPTFGYIGLQSYANSQVAFRNIRIKEL